VPGCVLFSPLRGLYFPPFENREGWGTRKPGSASNNRSSTHASVPFDFAQDPEALGMTPYLHSKPEFMKLQKVVDFRNPRRKWLHPKSFSHH